jgi:hypothetical protein
VPFYEVFLTTFALLAVAAGSAKAIDFTRVFAAVAQNECCGSAHAACRSRKNAPAPINRLQNLAGIGLTAGLSRRFNSTQSAADA